VAENVFIFFTTKIDKNTSFKQ